MAKCEVCGTVADSPEDLRDKHAEMRHPVVFEGDPVPVTRIFGKKSRQQEGTSGGPTAAEMRREQAWPFDPVLRMALINKGILTPEDLTQAEKGIRAASMLAQQFEGGQPV